MSTNKIGKAIKANCEDDKIMQQLLLDLLDLNLTGKKWYKDAYMKKISFYAEKLEDKR